MTTKIKVKDKDNLTYKCDGCGETLKAKEFKLEKPIDNIHMMMSVMYVDKDGNPGKSHYDKLKKSDRLLACPYCDQIHLNGFDRV